MILASRAGRGGAARARGDPGANHLLARGASSAPGTPPRGAPAARPSGARCLRSSRTLRAVRYMPAGALPRPPAAPGGEVMQRRERNPSSARHSPARLSKLHGIPDPLSRSLPSRGEGTRPGRGIGASGVADADALFTSSARELPAVTGSRFERENALRGYPRPVPSPPSRHKELHLPNIIHFITAPFHNQQQHGFLLGGGGPN